MSFPIGGRLESRVHGQVPAGRDAALPQVCFPCRTPVLMMIVGKQCLLCARQVVRTSIIVLGHFLLLSPSVTERVVSKVQVCLFMALETGKLEGIQ